MSNRFLVDGTDSIYGVRITTIRRSSVGFEKRETVYGPYGSLGVARGMATRRGGEGEVQKGNTTTIVEVVSTDICWEKVEPR